MLSLALGAAVVLAYRYPVHVGHQLKVALVTIVYYLLAVLVPPPLAATARWLASWPIGGAAGPIPVTSPRKWAGALTVLPGALLAHLPVGGPACRRPRPYWARL